MYNPVSGTFQLNGQTFYNFQGEFEAAEPVLKSYLNKIGGDVDPHDDFWGLPDDDNIVVDAAGNVVILSNNQIFSL